MVSLMFAVLTTIGWGASDIFGALSSRRIGSYKTTYWVTVLAAVFLTLLAPLYLGELKSAQWWTVALSAALGIVLTYTYLAFTEALKDGDPAVVGTIAGSFVGPVVILSIIFLHSSLAPTQIACILAIIFGLTLTSLKTDGKKTHRWRPDRSTLFAFLTLAGWTVYFTFIKIPVEHMGWFWPEYIAAMAGLVYVVLFWSRKAAVSHEHIAATLGPSALAGLLGAGGSLAYNIALVSGNTAIIAPIAGSYPILFVFLSYLLFKQSVKNGQKIGIAITLVGIVALAACTVG